MYYNRVFDTYKSDMKKTWKTINKTLSRNKFSSELPSSFLHNDLELKDPFELLTCLIHTLQILESPLLLKLKIPLQTMQTIRSI